MGLPALRYALWLLAVTLLVGSGQARQSWEAVREGKPLERAIPAAEFSRLVGALSEAGGYFRSDNLVSNETAYLHIVDKLRELGASGGAYIGVGPEQNFSYIARIRPRIAFIVDIRRQAIIQHLMFKAIFHHAETQARFLSLLFSKPLARPGAPGANATIEDLVGYFSRTPSDRVLFQRNLSLISGTIVKNYRIPLNAKDLASLEYVYAAFRDDNLGLRYQSGGGLRSGGYPYGMQGGWGFFPTFQDIILSLDLRGQPGNFLAVRKDYEFVRLLQENNRIIPVVGDFAGTKALAGVAAYLKKNGYQVTAFYTSNVEQYLFGNGVFDEFARNVAGLPISEKSLFIRAYPNNLRRPHPARADNHRLTNLLQKISVFLDDYRQGLYTDYWTLVSTHYIAP